MGPGLLPKGSVNGATPGTTDFFSARSLPALNGFLRVASITLILTGTLTAIGMFFHAGGLRQMWAGDYPMPVRTSAGFVMAGCFLWMMRQRNSPISATRIARVARVGGMILCAIGLVALIEHLFESGSRSALRFPLLELLIETRPAILTSVNFILYGLAMVFLDKRSGRGIHPSEILTLAALLVSMLAIIGFACGVPSFYRWYSVFHERGMSLVSTLLFLLFGVGLFCLRPNRGFMAILTSPGMSGSMLRWLVLTPVLIPLVTGLLKIAGLKTGVYNPEIAAWLFSFLNLFFLTCAIIWSARLLYRSELDQKFAEETLHRTNSELESRVHERTAELSVAEAKFRRLVEQSLVGIYVIQNDRFIYANPKMAAMFGYSQDEMTSRPLQDFVFPADLPTVSHNLRRRFEGQVEAVRYQLRGVRSDGAVIHLAADGSRSEFNGQPAVLGALLDITESKKAEDAVRESEERYRLLVENSTELVCEASVDGLYRYVSPSYKVILGYDSDDLLHTSVFAHMHPEDAP
ncbi:MAG TPA: PAS domain S-box protein, partial [Candidatus Acidoferrum sp.]|nr:PAS domain S-box protein [Candidatus Acidoferrum sp.]